MFAENENVRQSATGEAVARLQSVLQEAKALQNAERALASVERSQLGRLLEPYDATNALEALRLFREAVELADAARTGEAQNRLAGELRSWRAAVSKRDDEIMPRHLRRFCERTDEQLDDLSYAALVRFYRRRSRTDATQSKYDLVVTRLCVVVTEEGTRSLRMSRQQLAAHLARTFAAWDIPSAELYDAAAGESSEPLDADDAIRNFDAFIAEANEAFDLKDLLQRKLFDRVRAFKRSLAESFYEPVVTAAAIETNVMLANTFASLLKAEGEQIHTAPAAYRELVSAFSNTSYNGTPDEMALLLEESQIEAVSDDAAAARERLARLGALLHIAGTSDRTDGFEAKTDEAARVSETSNNAPEVPAALRDFAAKEGDESLVVAYRQPWRSPEVRALDFSLFVRPLTMSSAPTDGGEAAAEGKARQQALALIMRADDMLGCEVLSEGKLSPDINERLTELSKEIAATEEHLNLLRGETWQRRARGDAEAVLYVINNLRGAGLRLHSALVDRAADELSRQRVRSAAIATATDANVESVGRGATPAAQTPFWHQFRSGRRGIVAAVVMLLLVATAIWSLASLNETYDGSDMNVSRVAVEQLPSPHLFAEAYQQESNLIGVVSQVWAPLDADSKRRELQALLNYGRGRGIESVTLLDQNRFPLGSASNERISVLEGNFMPPGLPPPR